MDHSIDSHRGGVGAKKETGRWLLVLGLIEKEVGSSGREEEQQDMGREETCGRVGQWNWGSLRRVEETQDQDGMGRHAGW